MAVSFTLVDLKFLVKQSFSLTLLKGLPLANRWPYTDGSAGLGTSGESAILQLKRTPRLNTLMTTMKQFYRVKHSINTLNNKNNKAKRNKE